MFIWLKNDLSGWRITLRNICQLWSRWKISPSKHWDGLIQNSKKKAHPLHFIAFQLSPPWIFSSSGACCWSILGAGNLWNCIPRFQIQVYCDLSVFTAGLHQMKFKTSNNDIPDHDRKNTDLQVGGTCRTSAADCTPKKGHNWLRRLWETINYIIWKVGHHFNT